LLADIEKLNNAKAEVEPFQLDDTTRPMGRINDGQRHWRSENAELDAGNEGRVRRTERSESTTDAGQARSMSRPRGAPRAPADPFFDKPYEPSTAQPDGKPSWEAAAKPVVRAISANIKPRKRVAALFQRAAPAAAIDAPAAQDSTEARQQVTAD
jgi:hypothetical protein